MSQIYQLGDLDHHHIYRTCTTWDPTKDKIEFNQMNVITRGQKLQLQWDENTKPILVQMKYDDTRNNYIEVQGTEKEIEWDQFRVATISTRDKQHTLLGTTSTRDKQQEKQKLKFIPFYTRSKPVTLITINHIRDIMLWDSGAEVNYITERALDKIKPNWRQQVQHTTDCLRTADGIPMDIIGIIRLLVSLDRDWSQYIDFFIGRSNRHTIILGWNNIKSDTTQIYIGKTGIYYSNDKINKINIRQIDNHIGQIQHKLQCKACNTNKLFNNDEELHIHYRKNHTNLHCEECNKIENTETDLINHIEDYHLPNNKIWLKPKTEYYIKPNSKAYIELRICNLSLKKLEYIMYDEVWVKKCKLEGNDNNCICVTCKGGGQIQRSFIQNGGVIKYTVYNDTNRDLKITPKDHQYYIDRSINVYEEKQIAEMILTDISDVMLPQVTDTEKQSIKQKCKHIIDIHNIQKDVEFPECPIYDITPPVMDLEGTQQRQFRPTYQEEQNTLLSNTDQQDGGKHTDQSSNDMQYKYEVCPTCIQNQESLCTFKADCWNACYMKEGQRTLCPQQEYDHITNMDQLGKYTAIIYCQTNESKIPANIQNDFKNVKYEDINKYVYTINLRDNKKYILANIPKTKYIHEGRKLIEDISHELHEQENIIIINQLSVKISRRNMTYYIKQRRPMNKINYLINDKQEQTIEHYRKTGNLEEYEINITTNKTNKTKTTNQTNTEPDKESENKSSIKTNTEKLIKDHWKKDKDIANMIITTMKQEEQDNISEPVTEQTTAPPPFPPPTDSRGSEGGDGHTTTTTIKHKTEEMVRKYYATQDMNILGTILRQQLKSSTPNTHRAESPRRTEDIHHVRRIKKHLDKEVTSSEGLKQKTPKGKYSAHNNQAQDSKVQYALDYTGSKTNKQHTCMSENAEIIAKTYNLINSKRLQELFGTSSYAAGDFKDLFGRTIYFSLKLTNFAPVIEKWRKCAPAKVLAASNLLLQLIKEGIIEYRYAKNSSQALYVVKHAPQLTKSECDAEHKDYTPGALNMQEPRQLRLAIDYRVLNARLEHQNCRQNGPKDIIEQLSGAKIASIIDLSASYYSLNLDQQSRLYTSVESGLKSYQGVENFILKKAPMGAQPSATFLQAAVRYCLHQIIDEAAIFSDNIVIYTKVLNATDLDGQGNPTLKMQQRHLETLEKALLLLLRCGFRIKKEKLNLFVMRKMNFLGHTICLKTQRVLAPQDKCQALYVAAIPENQAEMRSYLSACQFLVHTMIGCAKQMSTLYTMLRKTSTIFKFNEILMQAIEDVKEILRAPDQNYVNMVDLQTAQLAIATDASVYGAGIALMVWSEEDQIYKVIDYQSKTFNLAQSRYPNYLRELTALICAVETYQHYIEATRNTVTLYTDCQVLALLNKLSTSHDKYANIQIFLASFHNLRVLYLSAEDYRIKVVDYLSRVGMEHITKNVKRKQLNNSTIKEIAEWQTKIKQQEQINTTQAHTDIEFLPKFDQLINKQESKQITAKNESVRVESDLEGEPVIKYNPTEVEDPQDISVSLEEMRDYTKSIKPQYVYEDISLSNEGTQPDTICKHTIVKYEDATQQLQQDGGKHAPNTDQQEHKIVIILDVIDNEQCKETWPDIAENAKKLLNHFNIKINSQDKEMFKEFTRGKTRIYYLRNIDKAGNWKYEFNWIVHVINSYLAKTEQNHLYVQAQGIPTIILQKLLDKCEEILIRKSEEPTYITVYTDHEEAVNDSQQYIASLIRNWTEHDNIREIVPSIFTISDNNITLNMTDSEYIDIERLCFHQKTDPLYQQIANNIVNQKCPERKCIKHVCTHKIYEQKMNKTDEDKYQAIHYKFAKYKNANIIIRRVWTKDSMILYQICIPYVIADNIIKDFHTKIESNHVGAAKLKKMLALKFYIEGIDNAIARVLRTCQTCRQTKPGNLPRTRGNYTTKMTELDLNKQCWYIDEVFPIGQLNHGKDNEEPDSIITITHATTQFIMTVPIWGNLTARKFCNAIMEIIKIFGRPYAIITDNAKQIMNMLAQRFSNIIGYRHYYISPYISKSNLAELTNKRLLHQMRILCKSLEISKLHWNDLLPWVTNFLNSQPFANKFHIYSPRSLMMGPVGTTSDDLEWPIKLQWTKPLNKNFNLNAWLDKTAEIQKFYSMEIHKQRILKRQRAETEDDTHKQYTRSRDKIKIGAIVMMRTIKRKPNQKLDPNWSESRFLVIERHGQMAYIVPYNMTAVKYWTEQNKSIQTQAQYFNKQRAMKVDVTFLQCDESVIFITENNKTRKDDTQIELDWSHGPPVVWEDITNPRISGWCEQEQQQEQEQEPDIIIANISKDQEDQNDNEYKIFDHIYHQFLTIKCRKTNNLKSIMSEKYKEKNYLQRLKFQIENPQRKTVTFKVPNTVKYAKIIHYPKAKRPDQIQH